MCVYVAVCYTPLSPQSCSLSAEKRLFTVIDVIHVLAKSAQLPDMHERGRGRVSERVRESDREAMAVATDIRVSRSLTARVADTLELFSIKCR